MWKAVAGRQIVVTRCIRAHFVIVVDLGLHGVGRSAVTTPPSCTRLKWLRLTLRYIGHVSVDSHRDGTDSTARSGQPLLLHQLADDGLHRLGRLGANQNERGQVEYGCDPTSVTHSSYNTHPFH